MGDSSLPLESCWDGFHACRREVRSVLFETEPFDIFTQTRFSHCNCAFELGMESESGAAGILNILKLFLEELQSEYSNALRVPELLLLEWLDMNGLMSHKKNVCGK